ncbi:exosortase H [Geobacter grbiciae]|uniref:exosortase H n=1 Tax=Geobacter grbiciae TaxID=155042 RepID=UPI001C026C9A|nr:exosortase H [Geobacter grbiciae]
MEFAAGHDGGTIRAIRFAVVALVLFLAQFLVPEAAFEPLNRVTAIMAAELLGLMGRHAQAAGTLVRLDGFSARVVTECSVINPAILFISFVFGFAAPLRAKAAGILAGIPILNSINVLRIAAVIATGAAVPALFEAVHVYVGQILMVGVVLFGAILWSRWASADGVATFPFVPGVLAWSVILFVPWLFMNRWYVAVGDIPLRLLFEMAGRPVELPVERPLYYQTFNSVLFASLVLATGSIPIRRKAVFLAGGLALLAVGHQLFRVCNILFSAFGIRKAYLASVAIHEISGYLLPFLLWFILCHRKSRPSAHRQRSAEKDCREADPPG